MSKKILIKDWKPQPNKRLDYSHSFVEWINSINTSFEHRVQHAPFERYKEQVKQWQAEIPDFIALRGDDLTDAISREQRKCKNNSLFACNQYLYLKQGHKSRGKERFEATAAQEIVLYLLDCGYNFMIGKPRQVGFTSVIAGAATLKSMFSHQHFTKYITAGYDKGEEIFSDKFKFAYENVDEIIKISPDSYTQKGMRFGVKDKKGDASTGGAIQMFPPTVDAINGGSPDIVLIDEIGLIPLFGQMAREAWPTMFLHNKESGLLEQVRQIICWGTGGSMNKAGAIFEDQWNACKKNWEEKNWEYGMFPLFFNCFARIGMTKEFYDKEKRRYYSTQGVEREMARTQFHQAYPMSEADMFLRSTKPLIPMDQIIAHCERINMLSEDSKPRYGFFEPEYDKSVAYEGDKYLPWKVKSVQFIPTKYFDDPRTTTILFEEPDHDWTNRYYKGTDPISSETGQSRMASAVWDAETGTVSAITNLRGYIDSTADPGISKTRQSFRECLLLNMYYGTIPELVEANIGGDYMNYLDTRKMRRQLIMQTQLPVPLRNSQSSKVYGIYNSRGNVAARIIDATINLIDAHGDNINIVEFYDQLKHFTEKELTGGKIRYQSEDLRYYRDDIIFAVTFAYIAYLCHERKKPRKKDYAERRKARVKLLRGPDLKLYRAKVHPDGRQQRIY